MQEKFAECTPDKTPTLSILSSVIANQLSLIVQITFRGQSSALPKLTQCSFSMTFDSRVIQLKNHKCTLITNIQDEYIVQNLLYVPRYRQQYGVFLFSGNCCPHDRYCLDRLLSYNIQEPEAETVPFGHLVCHYLVVESTYGYTSKDYQKSQLLV